MDKQPEPGMGEQAVACWLRQFRLSAMERSLREVTAQARGESWDYLRYLGELCEHEALTRDGRRLERLLTPPQSPSTAGNTNSKGRDAPWLHFGHSFAGHSFAIRSLSRRWRDLSFLPPLAPSLAPPPPPCASA